MLVQHEHRWSWPPCDRKVPDSWLHWKYHYMTVGNPPSSPFRYPPNWLEKLHIFKPKSSQIKKAHQKGPQIATSRSLRSFFAAFLLYWLDGLSKWTRNLWLSNEENLNGTPGTKKNDGISPGKVAPNSPDKWSKPGIDHQIRGKCATACENLWINFPVCSGMCRKHWKPPRKKCFSISLRVYPTREANPVQKRVCHGRPRTNRLDSGPHKTQQNHQGTRETHSCAKISIMKYGENSWIFAKSSVMAVMAIFAMIFWHVFSGMMSP